MHDDFPTFSQKEWDDPTLDLQIPWARIFCTLGVHLDGPR